MARRAKIAATLGPACDSRKVLGEMIESGMDIARLNFSHGTPDDHRKRASRLRTVSRKLGTDLALVADLQGPRFRVGTLNGGSLELVDGERVEVLAGRKRAPAGSIPVSYAALSSDVRPKDRILIDDGKIDLRVISVKGDVVRCEVARGGTISDNKGINLPGCQLSVPTLTRKDRHDLRTAVEIGADWLAISFVRSADDLRTARKQLQRVGSDLPLLAKIERPEAVDQLGDILEASDGILVARGDLGVELPPERVPILQKQIIERANAAGKPVMTATQMLESMRHSPRPTRAEASDVANAVLDGSSSLLLTAETAAGDFPTDAVTMMDSIILQAEGTGRMHVAGRPSGDLSVALTVARAGCRAAYDVRASHIVVFTQSGFSAMQAARFRPSTPILAFSPSRKVCRQLRVHWGIEPRKLPNLRSIEALMAALDDVLLEQEWVQPGDIVVVLSGSPIGVTGTTNLMKVHRVGTALGNRR
ncbi:MAG: pyruvate kinase [Acidobacteriota bacterium]|nr:pyruvate kinase [Acidobacteriota bacterium]MDH3784174.1 pyruvate kinase [Acidobacteriota bacterium]